MVALFVVRWVDADGNLLAWARVPASPKPQASRASCPFWPVQPTSMTIERDGAIAQIVIHWPDLDIARVKALPEPQPVTAGQTYLFTWLEPIWLVAGMANIALAPVTETAPVTIGVPTARLGIH